MASSPVSFSETCLPACPKVSRNRNGLLSIGVIVIPEFLDHLLARWVVRTVVPDAFPSTQQTESSNRHESWRKPDHRPRCSFPWDHSRRSYNSQAGGVWSLPFVVASVEVNQFVCLGANRHLAGVVVMCHVHPIAIVDRLFPIRRFFTGFADRSERTSLHLRRRLRRQRSRASSRGSPRSQSMRRYVYPAGIDLG